MAKVLLEDDIALNRAIKKITELDGHTTKSYFDGQDVYDSLSDRYDLYILDINVPNINGLELLKLIYEKNSSSKVIIISANSDIYSLTEAYKLGCIDYLKKPFHLEELRIKIAKQRVNTEDILKNISLKDDISLTKKEKVFLTLLLTNSDKIVTYKMIEDGVYGEGNTMSMDSLRALVRRLRPKLKDILIENVLEEGYKVIS